MRGGKRLSRFLRAALHSGAGFVLNILDELHTDCDVTENLQKTNSVFFSSSLVLRKKHVFTLALTAEPHAATAVAIASLRSLLYLYGCVCLFTNHEDIENK